MSEGFNVRTFSRIARKVHRIFRYLSVISSAIAISFLIYDIGFRHPDFHVLYRINQLYIITALMGAFSLLLRYLDKGKRPPRKLWLFDVLIFSSLLAMIQYLWSGQNNGEVQYSLQTVWIWIFFTLLLHLFREIFSSNINQSFNNFNPAQLFTGSFLVAILAGAFALKLPNATSNGISMIDALFTSTSAVCVTGLAVIDTGKDFTRIGQYIIMILIQLGGLGMMTFTSFFSSFFKGSTSYKGRLLVGEISNSGRLTKAYGMVRQILFFTLGVELIGGVLIYHSLNYNNFTSFSEKIFFSVFHSVSAFCNAGFSTLSQSLYEVTFRFNYPLQIIIALLFIFGGLGFPIVFNFVKYLQYQIISTFKSLMTQKSFQHRPWIININSRIVLITTLCLILFGTFSFFIFEYNNTLAEHSLVGKITVAFFNAVTPRTAGFNSIDFAGLNFSTLMLVFFLMWIGASPMSTGGGIKTTTFALATLNFISLAKGKDRIDLFRREISDGSVRRAFGVISLSLIVIGTSVFFIAIFDEQLDLLHIAFEVFSAYSTVGLSLGITGELTDASKVVLILTMFIGRVTMLTILVAFFRRVRYLQYKYPTEEILIN
ncbi:TrkH family potassium uptake protein [Membranihabitans maritimus]|uniref:TrkH family potassium uptake protein n=1 Tax=Membranihabitans maritimus TaxID=2904244 RepID=UPI001F263926|nr:potassium transporter TrkG [Membranihabitans maritimus]